MIIVDKLLEGVNIHCRAIFSCFLLALKETRFGDCPKTTIK
jgi:hypothetical protein